MEAGFQAHVHADPLGQMTITNSQSILLHNTHNKKLKHFCFFFHFLCAVLKHVKTQKIHSSPILFTNRSKSVLVEFLLCHSRKQTSLRKPEHFRVPFYCGHPNAQLSNQHLDVIHLCGWIILTKEMWPLTQTYTDLWTIMDKK